ncbi:MAG: transglutaminase family protein, partial [Planctomycetota bacterium]
MFFVRRAAGFFERFFFAILDDAMMSLPPRVTSRLSLRASQVRARPAAMPLLHRHRPWHYGVDKGTRVMGIRVALHHKTTYRYDRRIDLGPQTVRLRPAPHCRTKIEAYSLEVDPAEHFCNWLQDPFGNYAARLVFPEKTERFTVDVDLVADLVVFNPFDFFLDPAAETFPFAYDESLEHDLEPCLVREEAGPLLTKFLTTVDRTERRIIDFLVQLNQRVAAEVAYTVRLEPGLQTCEETLSRRIGACRDSAWLVVQTLRHLGLAARFASGYLIQLVPDVKPLEGPQGPTKDFTDLHAWAEVYLPGAGWIGLDPTSGLFAGEGHIPVACTPDPVSAAPITGALEPCGVEFAHEMSVTRLDEPARPTKPYTEHVWSQIDAVGEAVDRDLDDRDVRLTMGGEPTFVSADDMESVEWTFDALGDDKKRMAFALTQRLRDRFATGGILHESQGKWYPGEPLPRWAFSVFWRTDGNAIWKDAANLAAGEPDEQRPAPTTDDAERFIRSVADGLSCDTEHVLPAYEDGFYHMWQEKSLPRNIDPQDPAFASDAGRQRLSRLLRDGFDSVTGFAIPIDVRKTGEGMRWTSGAWEFRSGRLELLPGDSPMGLRLPLESIERDAEQERVIPRPSDPTEPRGPLAAVAAVAEDRVSAANVSKPRKPEQFWTALCVEPRDGRLHVFLPPTRKAEHYLELVAAIEQAAAGLSLPVVIEGYDPPADHRLQHFRVTPDPGVIEVNIHPSASWRHLSDTTSAIYDEARRVGLAAEKFMVDGRHVGTGGGAHIIVGGPTPTDSPVLRRPDLLRSLLAFWNNHPSLSYLFSGLFVGPTSQAPRVDESRSEAVSELAIAFEQITPGAEPQPWVVDRVFRHLLTDLTGNTHRSEFCIDKLYSPDSPSGRLGLLEFRAFEMMPHPRMNLTQQLLIRALIASF